jgi:hypothetical protein
LSDIETDFKKNLENSSDSITSDSADPMEFIEHDNKSSSYSVSSSENGNSNLSTIDSFKYGLRGDFRYW